MSQTDFDTVKKDEGKCYLRTECLYDDYFNNLIQTLKGLSPMEVDEFLDAESEKGNIDLSEADKKRLKEELLQEMLEKKKGGKE